VQRGDHGLAQLLEKERQVVLVEVIAGLAVGADLLAPDAVKTELVLDVHDVGVGQIDRARGGAITLGVALVDAPAHVGLVGAQNPRLLDGRDAARRRGVGGPHGRHQIPGEGCDPTPAGYSGRDEGDANILNLTGRDTGAAKIVRGLIPAPTKGRR
jgi:hypothetical protein